MWSIRLRFTLKLCLAWAHGKAYGRSDVDEISIEYQRHAFELYTPQTHTCVLLPFFLARNKDVFYVNDGKTVEQWCPGTVHCRKVLDEGEAINGIKMGLVAGIDCEKDDSLLVTDPVNNRIVRTELWNLDKPYAVQALNDATCFRYH